MLKTIKNYFWNILSIILIITISEATFFYYKFSHIDQYKTIQSNEIILSCKLDAEYLHVEINFCQKFFKSVQDPIHLYSINYFSLDVMKNNHETKFNNLFLTYKINLELKKNEQKPKKFNEKEFKTYIFTKADKYLEKVKILAINDNLHLQNRLRIKNLFSNIIKKNNIKNLDFYEDKETEEYFSLQHKQNIEDIEFHINEIKNIKTDKVIDVNFKYSVNYEKIKSKFNRLNYFNILLISLIFGIYVNIIVIILLRNNLLKK